MKDLATLIVKKLDQEINYVRRSFTELKIKRFLTIKNNIPSNYYTYVKLKL